MMMMMITTMAMDRTVLVRIQIDISSNKHDNQCSGSVRLGLAGLGGATQSMIEYNFSFTKKYNDIIRQTKTSHANQLAFGIHKKVKDN